MGRIHCVVELTDWVLAFLANTAHARLLGLLAQDQFIFAIYIMYVYRKNVDGWEGGWEREIKAKISGEFRRQVDKPIVWYVFVDEENDCKGDQEWREIKSCFFPLLTYELALLAKSVGRRI